ANPGVIVHIDGQILGEHSGIVNYTIGQRRGIGVATGEALYVIYLDVENACVIVGPREMLETRKLFLRDVNWLGDEQLDNFPLDGIDVAVKVRSTRPPRSARLHYKQGSFSVDLLESESGVAPGQACVL
ncbi:MAG: tRNA 2-thiouridine(34) synthase MnmA, partial [Bartonella sp.]|nr:tRNA 2-thiouridine(34) synthase MnmA [Bartonella sp.]